MVLNKMLSVHDNVHMIISLVVFTELQSYSDNEKTFETFENVTLNF